MKKAGEHLLTFGKYSGQRLASLPEDYLTWMKTTLEGQWGTMAQQVLDERSGGKFRARVTFGKYKGEFLDTLPDQHLQWMISNMKSPRWKELAQEVLSQRTGHVPARTCSADDFKQAMQKSKDLADARSVYCELMRSSLCRNRFLGNFAVEMFGKCGGVEEAREAFADILHPNVYSWNIMLKALVRNKKFRDAEELFGMIDDEVRSLVTWNIALEAVAGQGDLEKTRAFFGKIEKPDVFSWTIMLTALLEKGRFEEAKEIFESMEEVNTVTLNAMLNAHAQHGQLEEARRLFDGIPEKTAASWNIMISAYADAGQQHQARRLFDLCTTKDQITWNAILNAYAATGHLQEAKEIYTQMPLKDETSLACMLQVYAEEDVESAKHMFEAIPTEKRTIVHRTIMMQAYSKVGDLEGAKASFEDIANPDVVATNAMLAAYAQNGHLREAVALFETSKQRDLVTFNIMISAYGLSGCCDEAQALFDEMKERDVYSWTALITTYSQNDLPHKAFAAYQHMLLNGVHPNKVTMVSLLVASQSISQSFELFTSMSQDYNLEPDIEHYNFMVKALCKESRFADAKDLIYNMPFIPDSRIWMTFLAACRSSQNVVEEYAEHAAEEAFRLDPKASPFALLAEVYTNSGNEDKLEKLKKRMKESGVELLLSSSWVDICGKMHKVCVSDKPSDEVCKEITRLKKLMPNERVPRWNEKNADFHSEKVALTLASTAEEGNGGDIRIINNLRTCDDCHSFLQSASKVLGRRIILRDVHHVHHFEEGKCRCGAN